MTNDTSKFLREALTLGLDLTYAFDPLPIPFRKRVLLRAK
jgi:hypothetical protein